MESNSVYYVQTGAVEVFHTIRNTKIVVALIGAGNFFGEIGFFDGISRIHDVRAVEDSTILEFDEDGLNKVQQENPVLYGQFLTFLGRSVCAKFRDILEDREPLTAYAASLSTGRSGFDQPKPLPEQFFQTLEWKRINKVIETFKASFFDLSFRLQRDNHPGIPSELESECKEVLDDFNNQLESFNRHFSDNNLHRYVWGYAFKEIFPYFMRSRFAERAYFKPKGYPGDFQMIELIYRNQPEGDGKLGVLVDRWCLNSKAARAVRGRRKLLSCQLETISRQKLDHQGSIRIMNLACGANRELFDFLSGCDYTDAIEALCIDADPEALEYTNRHVNSFAHHASIRLMNDNVVKWALGRTRHKIRPQDIVYSSGLADYLDRRLFLALVNRCYEYMKPGGVLIIGNFTPENSNKSFMDYILQWKLIHRDQNQLEHLFLETRFGKNVKFLHEEQEVNLFAVATKPDSDS
jgi:CRP-like cAMP-binding protein/SAM-dependent methyltransferase